MTARLILVASAAAVVLGACGSSVFSSRDVRFELGETPFVVLESGAVVIDGQRVGTVQDDGKVVSSKDKLVMWIYDAQIRLRGGVAVPIRTDQDGAMYLPSGPQERAGLKPMTRRVRADGRLAMSENSAGIDVRGTDNERNRRIVLGVLLAYENSLWE